ncbi:MAG TPA: motility associated factor glycosyltransferase family protein [Clostridiaceae bacterium]|nr:motility associated factor glycosyltransferase family protein [Clostridiaceae bacterium]
MELFKRNLKLLEAKAPALYRMILDENPLFDINMYKMQNQNNYIIESKEAKCFLQSVYNVENEVKMMLHKVEKNVSTIILFGIGNGYALEHIINYYENLKEIIIIEPTVQIFKAYMENNDLTTILKKDLNITFLVNKKEDVVVQFLYLKMIESKNCAMVFHVSYCSVFNSYYNNVINNLNKFLKIKIGDITTLASQWQGWLVNSIKNLRIQDTIPIENIIDAFKGKTAVIVSAGPSLNKNMHLIEKLKEKAIIFAVGSAIKILDSNGIIPHFRVAIDASPGEKKIFDNINTRTSPLIFSNTLFYEILPEYAGDKFRFILETEYIGKYIYKKMNIPFKGFLSGASVANGTLNFLCDIGCSRIIFMGQDLSYTEEGLYAKGRYNTEKDNKEQIEKRKYTIVENIYGEKVYTTDSFLQMKYTLEDTIQRYPSIEFINATEGGLAIDGAVNLTAQELLDRILKEKEINIEQEIKDRLKNENIRKKYNEKLNQGLALMKHELIEIKNVQDDIIQNLRKLEKLKQKNASLNRLENEIRYLESLVKKVEEFSVYKEVIAMGLEANLLSIKTSFSYKGSDRNKIIESKERIITNSIALVKNYIELALLLIENETIKVDFEMSRVTNSEKKEKANVSKQVQGGSSV